MPETLFEEMKRYVRFGEADSVRLRLLSPVAEPQLVRIATEFYDRIREHEDAHAVFTGEEQIQRLQRTLVVWMRRLLSGPHDEAYYSERSSVGRTHVRIGLPQRYMFTAIALIRVALGRLTEELPKADAVAVREALDRALDLDLAIMLETYRDAFGARLARLEGEEREKRLERLARSEQRYLEAVEAAPMLVVGVDRDGVIGLFNLEAERVTGLERTDAIGRPLSGLLPSSVREVEGARIVRMARGEEPVPDAWAAPVLTVAGRERIVEWRLARVPDAAPDEVVLVAAGHDATDEREREERTRRAERLAAVGTLAAGLAHEIRNPLNGALLHVTYLDRALTKSGGSEEAHAAVKLVGDEIRRLSVLVKDFLVFARPSPPNVAPTAVHALCKRVLALVATDAAAAHAELRTDLGGEDILASLDTQKMEQVLLNLVRNAIEAIAAQGGGVVTVRVRRLPRAVQLDVEDDGPGLPAADAPVFDAFYTTKPSGTGLGLSIVHRIVTDHGGSIAVESRPGRTVFRLALPLAAEGESV